MLRRLPVFHERPICRELILPRRALNLLPYNRNLQALKPLVSNHRPIPTLDAIPKLCAQIRDDVLRVQVRDASVFEGVCKRHLSDNHVVGMRHGGEGASEVVRCRPGIWRGGDGADEEVDEERVIELCAVKFDVDEVLVVRGVGVWDSGV